MKRGVVFRILIPITEKVVVLHPWQVSAESLPRCQFLLIRATWAKSSENVNDSIEPTTGRIRWGKILSMGWLEQWPLHLGRCRAKGVNGECKAQEREEDEKPGWETQGWPATALCGCSAPWSWDWSGSPAPLTRASLPHLPTCPLLQCAVEEQNESQKHLCFLSSHSAFHSSPQRGNPDCAEVSVCFTVGFWRSKVLPAMFISKN